ncbi:hypothetical protein SODALDRAFT_400672 [Sodiomyces alkalinus F11]|uniref:Cyclase n=1 Tax=Sodiomyces alkalinus (strain CBS 110278 / VKM F-3762 / F11) TaxID=1314773 RepID=A0A3N2PUZ2_SODAK|nr:hypothetical protein SODALDRAFT_400672 [Sodiomyces alkalinus F11]ROT38298.1 hypothetical protein SODALDRAFT_400672 [Sodiomyces alkalinus F11]
MRFDPNADASALPKRSELPFIPGAPPGAAWFWGPEDQHGRLNLLTQERLLKTVGECVKTGQVINLSLPYDIPGPALFKRETFHHKVIKMAPGIYDEVFELNPQSSSQWDGFRHMAHPETKLFYNGLTSEEIDQVDKKGNLVSPRCGAGAWGETGIVGRGVLLDMYTWSGESYDPFTTHPITRADLEACAKSQGITFQTGDILFIRAGWVKKYMSLDTAEREKLAALPGAFDHTYAGIDATPQMVDFLHDHYFAAAVSDQICFEMWPPKSLAESLHAFMLPLWGMPIGELFDLEKLSEVCRTEKRYTFLLSSSPAVVRGSIGSPANSIAIL